MFNSVELHILNRNRNLFSLQLFATTAAGARRHLYCDIAAAAHLVFLPVLRISSIWFRRKSQLCDNYVWVLGICKELCSISHHNYYLPFPYLLHTRSCILNWWVLSKTPLLFPCIYRNLNCLQARVSRVFWV